MKKDKFNVIVIIADTLRRDYLSIYNPSRRITPFLEDFSKECLVFYNAYASCCWTIPSHMSLFTGLSPLQHKVTRRTLFLSENTVFIPELFKKEGYYTAFYSYHPYLLPKYGFDRGFISFNNLLFSSRKYKFIRKVYDFLKVFLPSQISWRLRPPDKINAEEINRYLFSFLKQRKTPFFLTINYMDTHWPYGKYRRNFILGCSVMEEQMMKIRKKVLMKGIPLDEEEKKVLEIFYESAVRYLDANIRKLIEYLKKQKIYEETIIIFIADHGEMLGEKGLIDHILLYNPVIRIPLLIKFPYSDKKGKCYKLFQEKDVLNLILQYIHSQGRIKFKENYAIFSYFFAKKEDLYIYGKKCQGDFVACITPEWKYIYSSHFEDELYNIEKDPQEEKNLINSPKYKKIAERLRKEIEKQKHLFPKENGGDEEPELKEHLKNLGYI